jgi:adenylyltransferase/sulfurtransferase
VSLSINVYHFIIRSKRVRLNSRVKVDVHQTRISTSNVRDILGPYDIILDCTDNSPTRYLLSDTCVVLGKPLVSGAALQFDGQLCVYNYKGGPCYRCLFPRPPPPETVGSCMENGVLGTITGTIGTLQALEAIKIVTGLAGRVVEFSST